TVGGPAVGGAGDGAIPGGGVLGDGEIPAGGVPAGRAGGPGAGGGVAGAPGVDPMGSNVLSERFLSVDSFAALVAERVDTLESELFDSGVAADVLATWTTTVTSSGLVDAVTVTADADSISTYFG
ncbi:MAG: hypothetical protein WBP59_03960, partial [Ilumatobacteraceae bacterium]